MSISIDDLKALCFSDDNIIMTQHLVIRCREHNIRFDDIKNSILNGEIIEQYPTDFPYPSCLVLGITIKNLYLHIVTGIGDNKLWIITAYFPSTDKWENDFKTRKVGK